MVACADMITACAETNGCMCRHDHCIRRSLHVHAMSVYSHQDTPMYMQTLLLKHTARHTNSLNHMPSVIVKSLKETFDKET